jgi:hypothetical protein
MISEPLSYERLLKQRDGLLKDLRSRGVPVVSAGLSRSHGEPVLRVLVRPNFQGRIPETFEGTKVVVSAVSAASA